MQKILIIEDEAIIGMALAAELQDAGYHIIDICPTGEEALGILKTQPATVVILDVKLGDGMDGLQTLEEIRKICTPSPYIFIISGNSDVFTWQEINKIEIDAFFVKPVNINMLLQHLKQLSAPGAG